MAFGKRTSPPSGAAADPPPAAAADNVLHFTPKKQPASEKPSGRPSADVLNRAAAEFAKALVEAHGRSSDDQTAGFHVCTIIAVASAVLGQAAVRRLYSDDALNGMPELLPAGVADGPIYADIGLGRDTIFHLLLVPARGKVAMDRLPSPYATAQRLLDSGRLSIPAAYRPHLNPLKAMAHAAALAHAIATRDALDREHEMLMIAASLLMFLNNEKDAERLAVLIRLSLEVMLMATRVNPQKS